LIYLFLILGAWNWIYFVLICLSVYSLLCVGALCILFIFSMVEEVKFCMIENEGEVDENSL
jgi:hypothetical protein